MGAVRGVKTAEIPASHLDLLTRPVCGVLTTILADGQPQSSIVWVDFDGECACVNTTLQRHKTRAMLANPKVSLLVVDPENTGRFVQIRGDAELVTEGAADQADRMAQKYTGHPRFYGFVYPLEDQERETRVVCRIHPRRVTLDAIHSATGPSYREELASSDAGPTRAEAETCTAASRRDRGVRDGYGRSVGATCSPEEINPSSLSKG